MNLNIQDITFTYSSDAILDHVSLELGPSQILGIIGPNGAGKSTLVRCINNVLKPQCGNVFLDEQEVNKMSRREVARHIGYVPQSMPQTFPATVFDTVLMGRRPHANWRSSEEDVDKVVEILDLVGIADFALRNYNELSGGEQQRVLLARALVQEVDILLLDEPTSNLDIKFQLDVLDTIKELVQERGLSVIMVIHDLNLASKYADKVVMLKKGKILAVGDPVATFTPENILYVYGVEALVKNEDGIPYIIPLRAKNGAQ